VPGVDTDFRFVDTECSAAVEQRPGRRLYASDGSHACLTTPPRCPTAIMNLAMAEYVNVKASQTLNQADWLRSKGEIPSFTVRWDEKDKAQ
jgi:hypothetical protein